MSILFPVIVSTICSVAGQSLLKIGMNRMGAVKLAGVNLPGLIFSLATNWYVSGGLLVYGTGVFFWLVALSRASLSYTYPFASLSYVLITIVSFVLHSGRADHLWRRPYYFGKLTL
jgi:hypothetical protein